MVLLSKGNTAILAAFTKGYKITIDGEIVSSKQTNSLSLYLDHKGYRNFKVCIANQEYHHVLVHRYQAYFKFGDKIFQKGIVVRHLDGNQLNNHRDNLDLGTHKDNTDDRCQKEVKEFARQASNKVRKFTDIEMDAIRQHHKESKSYKKTMEHFGISSKGTMSRIINVDYVTNK